MFYKIGPTTSSAFSSLVTPLQHLIMCYDLTLVDNRKLTIKLIYLKKKSEHGHWTMLNYFIVKFDDVFIFFFNH